VPKAPLSPPRDLTIPDPGSTTARTVLSHAMGSLLHELAAAPTRAPAGARYEANLLARLVRAVSTSAPGALAAALRRPTVSGLLRCLRMGSLEQREAVFVELVAELAFELALMRALPEPVHLQRWPELLLSIQARVAMTLPRDLERVAIENGRLDLGGEVEHPYHPIAGNIVLALADNNPLALLEAHPDKEGNAIDLGGHAVEEWVSELGAALEPIARHLPDLRSEMDLFIAQVVPVGYDPVKHLSASYQEVIGTIYMTLHPSRMTLSEALIHEFSHNKLNALFELDEVLENAWSPLYTSPVRPDPRPLHGVLLAVHAFLPVARLYEQMIAAGDPAAQREDFLARFADIRRINREGAELILTEARPTPIGRGLLDEIQRWHDHYSRYEEGA
jgi:HEXXH motif-containing protein